MSSREPIHIRHEYAQYTFDQTGYPLAGWFPVPNRSWQNISKTTDFFD